MAQVTVKTLSWMEASVGTSAPGGDTRGCPFWSSPSPLPAPQPERASGAAARSSAAMRFRFSSDPHCNQDASLQRAVLDPLADYVDRGLIEERGPAPRDL